LYIHLYSPKHGRKNTIQSIFIYIFIVSSYTKYKYNRTQNTEKMKKILKTTVKKEKENKK